MARMTINGLAVSTGYGLWPQKFMILFLFIFEWSYKGHFSMLFLKFLKNGNFLFDNFEIKGSPFKKLKKFQKILFFAKNHTFSFWICIVHVLSFLLMYITLMYQKFSILTYFCMKIFIFCHGLLTAGLAKTTAHRVLFLVSMDSQRSK